MLLFVKTCRFYHAIFCRAKAEIQLANQIRLIVVMLDSDWQAVMRLVDGRPAFIQSLVLIRIENNSTACVTRGQFSRQHRIVNSIYIILLFNAPINVLLWSIKQYKMYPMVNYQMCAKIIVGTMN